MSSPAKLSKPVRCLLLFVLYTFAIINGQHICLAAPKWPEANGFGVVLTLLVPGDKQMKKNVSFLCILLMNMGVFCFVCFFG